MDKFEGNWWVPKQGDFVRLKKNLREEHSFRAGVSQRSVEELGLKKDKLYEVIRYEQDQEGRRVKLREVNVQYILGKRTKKVGREIPIANLDFFELAREHRRE